MISCLMKRIWGALKMPHVEDSGPQEEEPRPLNPQSQEVLHIRQLSPRHGAALTAADTTVPTHTGQILPISLPLTRTMSCAFQKSN